MNEIQLDARTSLILLDPETAPDSDLLGWTVSPEDREQWHRWLDCEEKWLNSLKRRSGADNTARAYRHDVLEFFGAYAHIRLMPWQVSCFHANGWVELLHSNGLAKTSINRKVAALSSFYHYASTEYPLSSGVDPKMLWPYPNPFAARSLRFKLDSPRPQFPSNPQIIALLGQIDLTTVTGLRNMALIFGMYATTRRVNEWTKLKWGDINDGSESKWFEYRYKGGEIKKQTLPDDVWEIIELYLKHDGRLATMQPESYIFITKSSAGKRIRKSNGADQVRPNYDPAKQAIGASHVNALIKRYGLAAGIPIEKLHAHAMRHAGARSRRRSGADVINMRDILGHANIQITQTYIDEVLDEPEDPYADTVGAVLPKQLKLLLKTR